MATVGALPGDCVRFYRDCFASEGADRGLWNLCDPRHGDRVFLLRVPDEPEPMHWTPDIGSADIDNLRRRFHLRPQHLELILGCHFICGRAPQSRRAPGRPATLVAPLIMIRCELEESPSTTLFGSEGEFNGQLLSELGVSPEHLRADWLSDPFSSRTREQIAQVLAASGIHVAEDFTDLSATLWCPGGDVSPEVPLRVHPGACLLVVERPRSRAGISHELSRVARLASREELSLPVQCVLPGGESCTDPGDSVPVKMDNVPGALTNDQKSALTNAVRYPMSVIDGAAGTGKTHTLIMMAIEYFLVDQSVLIVARSETALDVIESVLSTRLGLRAELLVRAGRGSYRQELRRRLKHLLRQPVEKHVDPRVTAEQLRQTQSRIARVESRFARYSEQARQDARRLAGGLFSRWRCRRSVRDQPLLGAIMQQLHTLHLTRDRLIAQRIDEQYRDRHRQTLEHSRQTLTAFLAAQEADAGARSAALEVIDFTALLGLFPIWITSLESLSEVLPLADSLFDLVIVEEANEVGVAEAIPALQRGRRAVIVGDPHQLSRRHGISNARQLRIRRRHHLTAPLHYEHSLLQVAQRRLPTSAAATLLREHFRGHPRLMEFADSLIYPEDVAPITRRPAISEGSPLRILRCDGSFDAGINQAEGDAIMDRVRRYVDYCRDFSDQHAPSIGLVTFFPSQARYLEARLLDCFSLDDLHRHALMATTAHGIQGHERDIVFVSCGIDADSSPGAVSLVAQPDIFNVVTTRARLRQYLAVSVAAEDLPNEHLLRRYLEFHRHIQDHAGAPQDDQVHRLDVCQALTDLGWVCHVDFAVSGAVLDLVAVRGKRCVAIDLIGFPGRLRNALTIERYRVYERADLTVVPLRWAEWSLRRNEWLNAFRSAEDELLEQGLHGLDSETVARVVRTRNALIALSMTRETELLQSMLQSLREVHHVLHHQLNSGELTLQRYLDVAQRAFLAALHGLEVRVEARKAQSLVSLAEPTVADANEEACVEVCESVVSELRHLASRFSKVQVRSPQMRSTLSVLRELRRLSDQVDLYDRSE